MHISRYARSQDPNVLRDFRYQAYLRTSEGVVCGSRWPDMAKNWPTKSLDEYLFMPITRNPCNKYREHRSMTSYIFIVYIGGHSCLFCAHLLDRCNYHSIMASQTEILNSVCGFAVGLDFDAIFMLVRDDRDDWRRVHFSYVYGTEKWTKFTYRLFEEPRNNQNHQNRLQFLIINYSREF